MNRVTGIGGIFFKAQDAPKLRAWYQRHPGIDPEGNKVGLWEPPAGQ